MFFFLYRIRTYNDYVGLKVLYALAGTSFNTMMNNLAAELGILYTIYGYKHEKMILQWGTYILYPESLVYRFIYNASHENVMIWINVCADRGTATTWTMTTTEISTISAESSFENQDMYILYI